MVMIDEIYNENKGNIRFELLGAELNDEHLY